MTQPPLRIVHEPHEVWSRKITARPFVVHHQVARSGEEAIVTVRLISETAVHPMRRIRRIRPIRSTRIS